MLPLGKHGLGIRDGGSIGQQRLAFPPLPQEERSESKGKRHLAASLGTRKHKGMRDALLVDELLKARFSLFLTYNFVKLQGSVIIFASECPACC